MKKVLTFMLAVAMLASLACVGASARVLITDTFDSWIDGGLWLGSADDPQGDLNVLTEIDGNNMLEGFPGAVVHQGHFTANDEGVGYGPGRNTTTTGTFWVELYTEIQDNEDAWAGLWWKNTAHEVNEGAEKADAFMLKYHPGKSTFTFERDYPEATTDEEKIVATYEDPRQLGANMSDMKPIVIGMRVDPGKISAFVDGKCIGSFDDPTIGSQPCPVILWNQGLHVLWDNYSVGDLAELPLDVVTTNPGDDTTGGGNDTTNNGGNGTTNGGNGGNNPPATEVVTKRVEVTDDSGNVVTDESGNAVTQVVSEVVTIPSADTNTGAHGNGGAQTGDMAVVVVAVMVIALGSALAVKRISVK